MLTRLLTVAGLVGTSLSSLAQTRTDSPPRFYLGAGVSVLTDAGFSHNYIDPAFVGPALTLGTHFTPRLSLQLGATYAQRTTTQEDNYMSSGQSNTSSSSTRLQLVSLPVLVRFTLTEPTRPFHVDGLGGVTILRSISHYEYKALTYGVPFSRTRDDASTKFNLTLGPALRYSLLPHLDVTADALANLAVGDSYRDFQSRLFWNFLAGVHFTFGQ